MPLSLIHSVFFNFHKDVLNNLDNLDSCDLEEDDLMLDVDLPEDVSLHSGRFLHRAVCRSTVRATSSLSRTQLSQSQIDSGWNHVADL